MLKIEVSVDDRLHILTFRGTGEAGVAPENVLGLPYHTVLPRIIGERGDAVEEVLSSGEALSLPDYRLCCPYESLTAQIEIQPIRSQSGEIVGASLTLELPRECSFVTRLSRSQSLIDIGKRASMLAHGVRNPLNAIKGAVTYLKSHYREDQTFSEFSDIIEQEITNLDQFISGFLTTTLEPFAPATEDLNDLLRKIQAVIAYQERSSGVQVDFHLTDRFLPVKVSLFQLEHAILNVFNNALQALSGGGRIEVRSSCEERQGRAYALVEICDNGPGMPPESVADGATPLNEAHRPGRGFGLFIAREALQNHGGALELQSREGGGTRVIMSLPLSEAP